MEGRHESSIEKGPSNGQDRQEEAQKDVRDDHYTLVGFTAATGVSSPILFIIFKSESDRIQTPTSSDDEEEVQKVPF